ncbi:hypothetical protein NLJ89_g659 [Agrocybe chaxingu]|uniref:RRM domain-containing protein n=1 Tax=Agrocybe chaxingu TaxID=84603 RepID=A0A9W8TER7_9AGAR|nr:hypothetical protein NLJ89_g659 [Agrocybe chaxingu]
MSAPPPPTAVLGSYPQVQPAFFADDPRIYFSKDSNTWRFEQDDGTELEFDAAKSAWTPLVDEGLVSRQQAAYSVAGVDESTPAAPVLKRESKKRKVEDYTSATAPDEGVAIKRGKADKKEKPLTERKSKNTAVYVTNLPLDTEQDELVERFSKCGVIEEDLDGEPKVKMYAREDGSFSGEALVVFFKEDSVILAVSLLDEAELRLGQPSTVMRVAKADFAHKSHVKLEEWGDDDGFGPQPDPAENAADRAKQGRVVVLKHMFTLQDLEKDASLLLDLKEDKEEDGIMTVKFRDPLSAQACVLKMNGRFFDKRRIEAEIFTGKQRFKRSGAGDDLGGEGEEAERKRLDDFAQWLMTEGD